MIEGLENAALELQASAGARITYFLAPDEKRLVSPEMLSTFATLLMMAFLAGFQDKAKQGAKKLGGATFAWLASVFTNLFGGTEVKDKEKIEAKAQEAVQMSTSMP